MSPILVRPVREQLEHDRIIRVLQSKWRRRYEIGINPGAEQNVSVGSGAAVEYPDLVLHSLERGRRLLGVVEIETGESVNHLEALSQWAHFANLRAPFQLYVPSGMVDVARRLCEDNQVRVSEIWSYHIVAEDVRFTLIHRSRPEPAGSTQASRRKARPPARLTAKAPVKKPAAAAKSPARRASKKAKRR